MNKNRPNITVFLLLLMVALFLLPCSTVAAPILETLPDGETGILLFSEGFESPSGTYQPPLGWEVGSGTSPWQFQAPASPAVPAYEGANSATFRSFSLSSGVECLLSMSSGVDLPSGTGNTLRFWMNHDTGFSGYMDRIEVKISDDSGATWDTMTTINRYDGSNGWKEHIVDLDGYAGSTDVRIGFNGISAYGYNIHLDEVFIAQIITDECRIGDVFYETLADALAAVGEGETITLLRDLEYNDRIWAGSSYYQSMTLDLNGFGLDISGVEVPIAALEGYSIYVTDGSVDGGGTLELNTTTSDSAPTGIAASGTGSTVVVDESVAATVTSDAGNGRGLHAYYGGTIEIGKGTVSGGYYGILAQGTGNSVQVDGNVQGGYYGTYVEASSSVTIGGNSVGSLLNGVYASGGAQVTVTEDVTGYNEGIFAEDIGTVVTAENVTSVTSTGAYAMDGAAISIAGNASGIGHGIYSYGNGSEIYVAGDVTSVDNGVYVVYGEATVDGTITAPNSYIGIDGDHYAVDDGEPGEAPYEAYLIYTGTQGGIVRVKIPAPLKWTDGIAAPDQHPFGGGDGSSAAQAYEISSPQQLAQLAYNVNNGNDYSDKYFRLVNDIDLAGREWVPIGRRFYPGFELGFNGVFDGNGHTIRNLTIGSVEAPMSGGDQTQAGLFGAIKYGAEISDIDVQAEIYTDGVSGVGALVGYSESGNTIYGCSASGRIVSSGSGDLRIGGLIGNSEGTSIVSCSSDMDIIAAGGTAIGGLAGWPGSYSESEPRIISGCVFTGSISAGSVPTYGGVGGIAGKIYGYITIVNSIHQGTVAGASGNIGGIVGYQHGHAINCYSAGTVSGSGNYPPTCVGGITGYQDWGKLINCYDSGRVSSEGTALVGGILAYGYSYTTVSNVFMDDSVNPDLFPVRSTGGNKTFVYDFSSQVLQGQDPGVPVEYASDVFALGEEAILKALNGWIQLNQADYPTVEFAAWESLSLFNDGYPYLVGVQDLGNVDDASLAVLTATDITLEPDFDSDTFRYSADAANRTSHTTVSATPANEDAVVSINGVVGAEWDIELAVGENTIDVVVTAGDGVTTKTYTLEIDRAGRSGGGGSSDDDGDDAPVIPPAITPQLPVFSDVPDDAWYKDAVYFIAGRGITSGIEADRFGPQQNLTRGQFVVLVMNAYQIRIQNQAADSQLRNFTDAGDTYYTPYLETARTLGIVKGIGDDLFAPERAISRQEMCVMLYNALQSIGELPAAVNSLNLSGFSDAQQIAPWAEEAMTAMIQAGVIKGSDNHLHPLAQTTRAEIAQVLYNLLNK